MAETQNNLGVALESKEHCESFAQCLTEAGQYGQTLQEYRPLLQQVLGDPALHFDAGTCLLGLGKTDEAIDQFRQALAIQPDLPSVRENLAGALKRREGEKAFSTPVPGKASRYGVSTTLTQLSFFLEKMS